MVSVGVFRKKIRDYIFTDSGKIIGDGPDNGFTHFDPRKFTLTTTLSF